MKKQNKKEKKKAIIKDGDNIKERNKSLEPEIEMDLEAKN